MNIKRKQLIKCMLNMALFTINIAGIIISCELFDFFLKLKKSGKADELGELFQDKIETHGIGNTYKLSVTLFMVCCALVIVIFIYFFYKLFQSMGEDRNIDIRISYVLGYRKEKVLKREIGYGMLWVLGASALAVSISWAIFKVLERMKPVAAMMRSAEMSIFNWMVCIEGILIAIVLTMVSIALRVQSKYRFTANNS